MKEKIKIKETDVINYSGSVKIQITRGKKVLSTYNYHNSGRLPLFKFLCNCLAGNYIERQRPCQIKLYYCEAADVVDGITPSEFNWESTPLIDSSSYVDYDASPVLTKTEDTCKVTYHFRIPFTQIFNGRALNSETLAGDSIVVIHAAGLFPVSAIGREDASAYYLFTKDNEWKPIEVSDAVGNFSLVVDWTLELQNR